MAVKKLLLIKKIILNDFKTLALATNKKKQIKKKKEKVNTVITKL